MAFRTQSLWRLAVLEKNEIKIVSELKEVCLLDPKVVEERVSLKFFESESEFGVPVFK